MTDPSMIEIKESNNAEISISKLVVPFDNHDYGSSSNLRETPSFINFFSKELNFSDFVLKNPTPLTSINTEIPSSSYSLPFFQPSDGIKDSVENLGELLISDRIESSPHRFKMMKNESDIFLYQTNLLSKDDFALFAKRIDEIICDMLQGGFGDSVHDG